MVTLQLLIDAGAGGPPVRRALLLTARGLLLGTRTNVNAINEELDFMGPP